MLTTILIVTSVCLSVFFYCCKLVAKEQMDQGLFFILLLRLDPQLLSLCEEFVL